MAFDYNKFLNQLKTVILNNGASLYASLTVNYPTITSDSIAIGEPAQLPRAIDRYPYIVLNMANKTNEFDDLGIGSGNKVGKTVVSTVDIYGFINVGSTSKDSDKQCFTLARNLEDVIDANPYYNGSTSSQSWDSAIVTNVTFGDDAYKEGDNEVYLSPVKISADFIKYGFR